MVNVLADISINYLYPLFNILFKRFFVVYKPLYYYYKNVSEKEQIDFFKKKIKKGMTVVDIGANIGFYSMLFSHLVGQKGTVYAFEPDEQNFRYLKKDFKEANNIIIEKLAVGNKNGKIRLYYSKKLNVDHQTYDSGEKRKYKTVDMVTVDYYLPKKTDIDL